MKYSNDKIKCQRGNSKERQRERKGGKKTQKTIKVNITPFYETCIMVNLHTLINNVDTMKGKMVLIETEISALN